MRQRWDSLYELWVHANGHATPKDKILIVAYIIVAIFMIATLILLIGG